jgi:hypothetical protein
MNEFCTSFKCDTEQNCTEMWTYISWVYTVRTIGGSAIVYSLKWHHLFMTSHLLSWILLTTKFCFSTIENISGWHLIYTKFGSVPWTNFSYLTSLVNHLMWSLHKVQEIKAWLEAASVCASTCFFHTNLWIVVTSGTGGLDLGLSCEFGLGVYHFIIIPT